MKPCRDCQNDVSEQAMACPRCGCPFPARDAWDGWGFEYRSRWTLLGLPLVHIAFKYRPNRTPVIARGVLAVGQFATGIVCVSQFGVGLVCVSQFTLAWYAVAQFAVAYALVAQAGLYIDRGYGQTVAPLLQWLGLA